MTARRFNRAVEASRRDTDTFEARFVRAYEAAIRAAGRSSAESFASRATALTAAAGDPPEFISPDMDEVLDAEAMAEDVAKRTRRPREQAAKKMVGSVLGRLGIAMDVAHVMNESLILSAGARAADATSAVREAIQVAIRTGIEQGLSVPNTAALIRESVNDIAPAQSLMLARTDLNGVQNGGSIVAAKAVYPEGNLIKQWLATADDRTRETHAEADGQQVPLDQPFQVGDDTLDYPGDPDGSDEEVCNCRCTVIYVEAPAREAVTAGAPPQVIYTTPAELARVRIVDLETGEDVSGDYMMAAAVDFTDGSMIAVYPTPAEAEAIARPDGQPAEELHVTLCFLPEAPDDRLLAQIAGALERIGADYSPLAGAIGGTGEFAEGPDGAPVIALPSVVDLDCLRVAVAGALDTLGVAYSQNHGWVPHMTLGYGNVPDREAVLGLPVSFAAVSLIRGTERYDAPLTATPDDTLYESAPEEDAS